MNWCSKANFLISSAVERDRNRDTGSSGKSQCGLWDADRQLPADRRWRRNAKDRRRNGNKRGLFDQKSFEGNPYRPVGHAAAKMINDGPDS